jgi:hypothetical protein
VCGHRLPDLNAGRQRLLAQNRELQEERQALQAKDDIIAEKEVRIQQLGLQLQAKDDVIAEKEERIQQLDLRLQPLDVPGAVSHELAQLVGHEMMTRFARLCSTTRLVAVALVSRIKFEVHGDVRRDIVPLFTGTAHPLCRVCVDVGSF